MSSGSANSSGERLAEVELLWRGTGQLQVPLGEVLAEGQPGHVVPALGGGNVAGFLADDRHEFDLEID
jgi:hypothetical protein